MSGLVLQEKPGVAPQVTLYANYCLVAALTVCLYDHCLVIEQEIEFVWRRRNSPASVFYVLLRVVTLCNFGLLMVKDFTSMDCHSARPVVLALSIVVILYVTILAGISALRVYAISGRDWRLPVLILLLLLLRVSFLVFNYVSLTSIPVPLPLGCILTDLTSALKPYLTVSLVASIAADSVVIFETWRQTYRVYRMTRRDHIQAPLTALLMRDGTIYFGVVIIIDCLDLIFGCFTAHNFDGFYYIGTALICIVLSRFVLNLREASLGEPARTTSSILPTLSSDIRFPSGLDAFGSMLSDILDDDVSLDEDWFMDDDED